MAKPSLVAAALRATLVCPPATLLDAFLRKPSGAPLHATPAVAPLPVRGSGRDWPPADMETLARLIRDHDYSNAALAQHFKTSIGNVANAMYRYGLTRRRIKATGAVTAPVDVILRRPVPVAASRAKYSRWTTPERERLARLVGLGLKNAALAIEFGLKSEDVVTGTLRRLGLTRWRCVRWDNTKITELRLLVAAHRPNKDIARRYNLSVKRVEQLLQQHEIRRAGRKRRAS